MEGVFGRMKYRHIHFIGIGGIGMSGIAQIVLRKGIKVSGSDIKESKITAKLMELGAQVFIGHSCENLRGADVVVYSSAITEENPEFREAKRLNIPLVRRAEILAQLMADKTVIAVTGSHGKTTTTSLVVTLLIEAGFSPTAAIGGILKGLETNAYIGDGKFFVAEADESDGSFLCYSPKYSIITNIDREHLDYYKSFENEVDAFKCFIGNTQSNGCVFCCGDDINLRRILKGYKNKYMFFGMGEDSEIYPANIVMKGFGSEFDCYYKGKFLDRFSLLLTGTHNISNSLGVIALGLELGLPLHMIKKALFNCHGSARRMEVKFKSKNFTLIDDYAHHPTEIRATLKAARNIGNNRIIAVFQPHRYTRTKLLLEDFADCFDMADGVIVTDIYAASESPIEGVSAHVVCEKIKSCFPEKSPLYVPKTDIIAHIIRSIKPGDLIITLGAGDITRICDGLAKELALR